MAASRLASCQDLAIETRSARTEPPAARCREDGTGGPEGENGPTGRHASPGSTRRAPSSVKAAIRDTASMGQTKLSGKTALKMRALPLGIDAPDQQIMIARSLSAIRLPHGPDTGQRSQDGLGLRCPRRRARGAEQPGKSRRWESRGTAETASVWPAQTHSPARRRTCVPIPRVHVRHRSP